MTEPRTLTDPGRRGRRYQDRCSACGRFARYPQDFQSDVVCLRYGGDPHAGVQRNRETELGVAERRAARQRARLLERGGA